MFGTAVDIAAKADARGRYPQEACGIVARGAYVPLANLAADPGETFRLPADTFARYAVEAVIHSHCAGHHPPWPSAADMRSQLETAVPWGIVYASAEDAAGPLWFGEHILDLPLLGRDFQPGIMDCYGLLRAFYWQERKVRLREFPRDPDWWHAGGDLFREGFADAGFIPVDPANLRKDDVVLMEIRAPVPNHCGIVLDDGLILHHLGNRLSRREPLGPWRRFITHSLRYIGADI